MSAPHPGIPDPPPYPPGAMPPPPPGYAGPGWTPGGPPGPPPRRRGLLVGLIVLGVVLVVGAAVAVFVVGYGGSTSTTARSTITAPASPASPTSPASPASPTSGSADPVGTQPGWTRAYAAPAAAAVDTARREVVATAGLAGDETARRLRAARRLATPSYGRELATAARQLAPDDGRVRVVGRVRQVSLESLGHDEAVVLVSATSTVTRAGRPATTTAQRLRLTLVRHGARRWLVDDLASIGTPHHTTPSGALSDPPFDTVGAHLAALLSYTPATVASKESQASAYLTGAFLAQYRSTRRTIVAQVQREQITSVTTVDDVGVVTGPVTKGRPQAVVYYTDVVRRASGAPQASAGAALVTLRRVDGSWRISALAPVP